MTTDFPSHARVALAWPRDARMHRKPHGQRWGEGLASVLDHLQHDSRHQPHPVGTARLASQRERKE
ncbi:MAG: hypothetical protein ACO1OY_02470 [Ramlibacter sp.]